MDGVFHMNLKKWELALMIGVAATILCCAVAPGLTMHWWTTAFSPLCDGILGADASGGEIVLRSKIWELLSRCY